MRILNGFVSSPIKTKQQSQVLQTMELFFECGFMLLPGVADGCEVTLDYLGFLAGVIQLNV